MSHEVYMAIPFVSVILIGFAISRLTNDWVMMLLVVLTPTAAIYLDLKLINDSFWSIDGQSEAGFGWFIYFVFTVAGMGIGFVVWTVSGFFTKQR